MAVRPSPEEFTAATLQRVLAELLRRMKRIEQHARHHYRHPTRSIEHEFDDQDPDDENWDDFNDEED